MIAHGDQEFPAGGADSGREDVGVALGHLVDRFLDQGDVLPLRPERALDGDGLAEVLAAFEHGAAVIRHEPDRKRGKHDADRETCQGQTAAQDQG